MSGIDVNLKKGKKNWKNVNVRLKLECNSFLEAPSTSKGKSIHKILPILTKLLIKNVIA